MCIPVISFSSTNQPSARKEIRQCSVNIVSKDRWHSSFSDRNGVVGHNLIVVVQNMRGRVRHSPRSATRRLVPAVEVHAEE
jgi:hypothetical protein